MTEEKWTICFDTVCQGYQPVMEGDSPIEFDNMRDSHLELASDPEFYSDCFCCPMSMIGHKTIYTATKKGD